MWWKTILVTGGCGFIGTNFIRFLLEKKGFDGKIVNVDVLTYAANPGNLEDLVERYPGQYFFHRVDICDSTALREVFEAYPIELVCHFAAESHVDRSIKNPRSFLETNVMGTFELLEMARRYNVARFHHVSTDEVYGSLGPSGAFSEESPYRPNSPYAASKAASDHLVRAYHKTYGLEVTISNCSNNYGPYQFPEKLIPLMILRGLNWEPLPVYGDGRHVRDWIHVEDHCEAIWLIVNEGKAGETYNVGARGEMENIELVGLICDILDEMVPPPKGKRRRDLITFVEDRPGHDRRYAINATKITEELHWRPRRTLEEGLRETIKWYLENPQWVSQVQSGEYMRWIEEHYGGRR
jgi:dTDP-glucose 4,6-dehydratase